jgi:hypothetical protein
MSAPTTSPQTLRRIAAALLFSGAALLALGGFLAFGAIGSNPFAAWAILAAGVLEMVIAVMVLIQTPA